MATDTTPRPHHVASGRLWFGLAASMAAWFALGFINVLLTWRACLHQEQFGGVIGHPGARIAAWTVTLILFAIILGAGSISYGNWKQLSVSTLENAEGTGRDEFVALLGLFGSLTLGVGAIWLSLPLLMIDFCVRTR